MFYVSLKAQLRAAVPALLLWTLLAAQVSAETSELSGSVDLQSRWFTQSNLYAEQADNAYSVAAQLDYYRDWDNYRQRLVISAFARIDSADAERSHADLSELYWWRELDDKELYAGIRQVFWGVTETVHLVDIINQTDWVEDIDGEEKLGQPMFSLLSEQAWGTVEIFALLGFRERSFPGPEGRLRDARVVDHDKASYQSSSGKKRIDLALRWSRVLGSWDIGLSHFSGTSRKPILKPVPGNRAPVLAPYYPLIEQSGLDLQKTHGAWLWKLEAISVKQRGDGRNTAVVGGFEYSIFGIADSAADVGLLLEYQFDDRRGRRATSYQNDLAVGARWRLNDFQSTEVLASASVDLDWGTRFLSVEASRRLSNYWSLEAEIRVFDHVPATDPLYTIRNDDYVQLELRRYF
ncbi:hypothetical protein [Gilvimarinus xylanilyticus]|uniref:Porin n=1 Tax=Gilvimarinus xylanilyticus TaxID=2944139 RepID=A0A9X2KUV4_9GAMM|nr:hypothetical protein [Gilvimarinus xylanilyticus]MCP8900597.1 hypothetical protein [Gilvimarinus xylanilyticus]